MQIKVSRDDLYNYCIDFGLMLSWGIPLAKVLLELEKSQSSPFFREISEELYKRLLYGSTMTEVLEKFPSVFKKSFLKWVRVGEKFGILDKALLDMAGVLRFDSLLMRENSSLSREELAVFLMKLSTFFKEKSSEDISSVRALTDNSVLIEWLEKTLSVKGKLFYNSQRNYLIEPVYRKIASPMFWHLLNTAEACGYLPYMLEILGLYFTDKNNLLPSDDTVTIERVDKENAFSMAEKILGEVEKNTSKKLTVTIKKEEFTVSVGGKEKNLSLLAGLSSDNKEKFPLIISNLKIIFDMDIAEKCLPQKIEKEYNINGRKYMVFMNIIPPYDLPAEGVEPDKIRDGTEIIEIELKGI
ncbi:MAG: type II secretion system F family protein [Candidatus Eremiobacterota bacterium]